MVQWLRLPAVNVVGLGLIHDQGTRSYMPQLSSHAATKDWHNQINKKQMLKKCVDQHLSHLCIQVCYSMLRVSNEQHPLGGLKVEISCEIHTRSTIIKHVYRTLCQTSFCGHLLTLFLLPVVTDYFQRLAGTCRYERVYNSYGYFGVFCFLQGIYQIETVYKTQHSESDSQLCTVTLFNKHCCITEIQLI